ncbi:hypothetical protein Tco_1283325 [Tanacetum coccineum]
MAYMNKNYGTLPVTAKQLLDIKTAQAEETVPEPQYQFSVIKYSLVIATPIVSMYLMSLISIIFETEPSDMIYIMLLAYTYAVLAGCFLTNIYDDAKVNPLRSIRVRALEASYYMGMAHMHNNLFTSQVTPEPLDIEMEQAEEMNMEYFRSRRRPGKEKVVEPDNDDKYIDVNDEPSDDDFVDIGSSSYASGLRRSERNKDKEVYDSDHAKTVASSSKVKSFKKRRETRKKKIKGNMSEAEKKAASGKPAGVILWIL